MERNLFFTLFHKNAGRLGQFSFHFIVLILPHAVFGLSKGDNDLNLALNCKEREKVRLLSMKGKQLQNNCLKSKLAPSLDNSVYLRKFRS
jgi:hypothetical protein